MSADWGWDLEQVTVSEVAVGCGCPRVNRIALLHFWLHTTGYSWGSLRWWALLVSPSGSCPFTLVPSSSASLPRGQMLLQISSYRFSQTLLEFPPFLWQLIKDFPKDQLASRFDFLLFNPHISSIVFIYQLSELFTWLMFVLFVLMRYWKESKLTLWWISSGVWSGVAQREEGFILNEGTLGGRLTTHLQRL